MISFPEMVQRYPIGTKVSVPGDDGGQKKRREIIGYEYYNGTGYLVFRDEGKMNVEQVMRDGVRYS